MTRSEVYKAIDGERYYQTLKWNEGTATNGGKHSWEDWITYMEDYLGEAKHLLSRLPVDQHEPKVKEIMRKVAALAVASMEQRGTSLRDIPENITYEV